MFMKNNWNYISVMLVLGLVLILNACTKQVAGPKGENGTPGKSGNLKQTHIGPFAQASSLWTFDGSVWTSEILASDITADVVSRGEVRVYMQENGIWWSLPHSVGDLFTQMSIAKGQVHLTRSKIHAGPPLKPTNTNFRVVIFAPVQ